MKKSDLKTGMRATTRRGGEYLVLLGAVTQQGVGDILLSESGFNWLSNYTDKLTLGGYLDIMKIEQPLYFADMKKKDCEYITIWERQSPKEMTLEDIEAELGYPVKIIGEQL